MFIYTLQTLKKRQRVLQFALAPRLLAAYGCSETKPATHIEPLRAGSERAGIYVTKSVEQAQENPDLTVRVRAVVHIPTLIDGERQR
jgi:hypothetical protein